MSSVYDRKRTGRPPGYVHQLIAESIPDGARVLDVGSAGGYLGEFLRAGQHCEVVCVDLDEGSVRKAQDRGFEAHQVDLEREEIDGTGFDVVVFADVLEHLRTPARTLRQAHPAPRVLVSMPNIGHWMGRWALARGRFPKNADGLFDATHLQFLTRDTMGALAHDAGWAGAGEQHVGETLPGEAWVRGLHRLRQPAADRFPTLFSYQFVLTLEPTRPQPRLVPTAPAMGLPV